MAFKDLLNKQFSRKEELKKLQEEDRLNTMVEERKKSANERELERFIEEERQKSIKKNLEEFRKAKQDEFTYGNSILEGKNIFKGQSNILHQDKSVLDNGKGILNDKKLFPVKKPKNNKKGGMFFK